MIIKLSEHWSTFTFISHYPTPRGIDQRAMG